MIQTYEVLLPITNHEEREENVKDKINTFLIVDSSNERHHHWEMMKNTHLVVNSFLEHIEWRGIIEANIHLNYYNYEYMERSLRRDWLSVLGIDYYHFDILYVQMDILRQFLKDGKMNYTIRDVPYRLVFAYNFDGAQSVVFLTTSSKAMEIHRIGLRIGSE